MGPYDNQNFIFLETPAVMEGHWYRGPSGEEQHFKADAEGHGS